MTTPETEPYSVALRFPIVIGYEKGEIFRLSIMFAGYASITA